MAVLWSLTCAAIKLYCFKTVTFVKYITLDKCRTDAVNNILRSLES